MKAPTESPWSRSPTTSCASIPGDCGNAELDEWLRNAALTADRMGTSRTYVWVDEDDRIVAYFATSPHLVERSELPRSLSRHAPSRVPSIVIAKLALASELHGEGLGGALLADALVVALDAMRRAGGRLVVVEAIDQGARGFYGHHGFKGIPDNPLKLCIKASSAAASLGVEWP